MAEVAERDAKKKTRPTSAGRTLLTTDPIDGISSGLLTGSSMPRMAFLGCDRPVGAADKAPMA